MNAMLRELHQARAARKRVDSRGNTGPSSASFTEGVGDFSSGGDGATSPITFATMAVKTTHLSTMAVGDFELDGVDNPFADPKPPSSRGHRRGDNSPSSGARRPQWAGRPSSGGNGSGNGPAGGAGAPRPQSSGPSSPGGTLLGGGPNARRRNNYDGGVDHNDFNGNYSDKDNEELVMDHKNPRHRRDPPLVQNRRPSSGSVVGGGVAGPRGAGNGGNRSPRPSSPRLSPRLASLADPNPRKVRPRPSAAAPVAPAPSGGSGGNGGAGSRDTDGGDSDSFDDLAQALRQGNGAAGGRQPPQKAVGGRVPNHSGPSGNNGRVLGGPGAPPPSAHHPTEESTLPSGGGGNGRGKWGGGGGKSLGPASGAVPLNVRNARRNAGDGDDHMVNERETEREQGMRDEVDIPVRNNASPNFDQELPQTRYLSKHDQACFPHFFLRPSHSGGQRKQRWRQGKRRRRRQGARRDPAELRQAHGPHEERQTLQGGHSLVPRRKRARALPPRCSQQGRQQWRCWGRWRLGELLRAEEATVRLRSGARRIRCGVGVQRRWRQARRALDSQLCHAPRHEGENDCCFVCY